MKTNILVISAFSVLLVPFFSAHAQNCPELSGEYVCGQSTQKPFLLQVTQVLVGNTIAYDFNSVIEGYHRVIPDGSIQQMQSPFGSGTYSAQCAGGRLLTTFLLTTKDGYIYQVQDNLRQERKALVRIRLSLPNSQIKVKDVYVCRPYIPPRR